MQICANNVVLTCAAGCSSESIRAQGMLSTGRPLAVLSSGRLAARALNPLHHAVGTEPRAAWFNDNRRTTNEMDNNIGDALGLLWIPAGFALMVLPIAALFLTI